MISKWDELKKDIADIRGQITGRQAGQVIAGTKDDSYLRGAATAYDSVAEWMRLLDKQEKAETAASDRACGDGGE